MKTNMIYFFALIMGLVLTTTWTAFSPIQVQEAEGDIFAGKTKGIIWTPKGIKAVKAKDGGILLRHSDYVYMGIDGKGTFHNDFLGAKLNCNCSEGSGCNPATAAGKTGCETDGCSSCLGTTSGLLPDLKTPAVTLSSGGFVHKSKVVRFAKKGDLRNTAFFFDAMLKDRTIAKNLKAFQRRNLIANDKDVSQVLIIMAGRAAVVTVSTKIAKKMDAIILSAVSCACASSGTCEREKVLGASRCKNNCGDGGCSMDTGVIIGGRPAILETLQF